MRQADLSRDMMQTILRWLLGVDPPQWSDGGHWSVSLPGAHSGDVVMLATIAMIVAALVIRWLYRREGQGLSTAVRWLLGGLRFFAIAMAALMLLEPMLVLTVIETQPSNLIVLVDGSDSMAETDRYGADEDAAGLAAAMSIEGGAEVLRATPRIALARTAYETQLAETLKAGDARRVHVHRFSSTLDDAADDSASVATSDATSDTESDAASDSGPEADNHATASATAWRTGGRHTALGAAIRDALQAYRGMPLAGLLVFSDGQSNLGPAPAQAASLAAADGLPIAVIGVGDDRPPVNARLMSPLDAPPAALVSDRFQITITAEAAGMTGRDLLLITERRAEAGDWEALDTRTLTMADAGVPQSIVIDDQHDSPGLWTYRARLAESDDEQTRDDNTAAAQVRVVRSQLRVLLVAGSPFPEVQFLRAALRRDTGVDLSSWLQSADRDYRHLGDTPIRRLPITQRELDDYDCVILYDPDPTRWPPDFPRMLHQFVDDAGGGLVLVAGENWTDDLFAGSPMFGGEPQSLRTMMPVVRETALAATDVSVRLSSQFAWKLDINERGLSHPIFQFANDPTQNRRILDSLPGMYWHFPVTRPKPGAVVLARHGDPRMTNQYGGHVLVATQLFGRGRTAFVGFDSTYRWRYLDEDYFDGFWARLVDHAGRAKLLGGRYPFRLTADRDSYQVGDQIRLRTQFVRPGDVDPSMTTLAATLETGGAPATEFALHASPDTPGAFTAAITADHAGPHLVRVWPTPSIDIAAGATPASLPFNVRDSQPERDRPQLDRATLQAVADASTGGQYFALADAARAADVFQTGAVELQLEARESLWDAPLLAMLLLSALILEWSLRKKYRLV